MYNIYIYVYITLGRHVVASCESEEGSMHVWRCNGQMSNKKVCRCAKVRLLAYLSDM